MLLLLHMPAAADIATADEVEESYVWGVEAEPSSTYDKTEDYSS